MYLWMTCSRIMPLLIPLLIACAGPTIKHEHEISPGREFDATIKTVLVVPLNETMEVERGLEQGFAATQDLIRRYLESKGLAVEQPTQQEYRKAVNIAANAAQDAQLAGEVDSVSENLSFTEVVPYLLRELDSSAELAVTPNMVIRTGTYTGTSTIKWDGVRRRERGSAGSSMSGNTAVASLYTVVYDRDGTRIFSGYGGLDLLFELNISKKRYEIREDRLQDVDNLAEGVCVSFHPFFGNAERC